MKLFVRIVSKNEYHFCREDTKDGEGWYEIEREPLTDERLQYDAETDSIVILPPLPPTEEELAAQQKAAEDAALMKADTIRALQEKLADLETRLANIEK